MKRANNAIVRLVIVISIMLCGMTVYATDTRFTQPTKPAEKIDQQIAKGVNATTGQTITFEEDEYVRITQPIQKEGGITTFESQINVMGEARKGTKITIKVYLNTIENGKTVSKEKTIEYKLAAVGGAQTFNQLIDLREGCNTVSVSYTHETTPDVSGEVTFVIKRQPEETKEAIKNFRVDNNNAILDKVGK